MKAWTRTFANDVVNDAHADAELEELAQMRAQLGVAGQQGELLAHVALVEGHLLRVGDQPAVHIAELALQLLLLDGEAASGPAQAGQKDAGEQQVEHQDRGRLAAQVHGQAVHVDEDVQHGLADVRVQVRGALAELVDVRGQQLVGVGYPVVQVRHFVVRVATGGEEGKLGQLKTHWEIACMHCMVCFIPFKSCPGEAAFISHIIIKSDTY